MPYFNVSWGGVVEAENYDAANAFAKRCGEVASRAVHAEIGGLFCGMEYLNDAEGTEEAEDEGDGSAVADNRCELCGEYENECLCEDPPS